MRMNIKTKISLVYFIISEREVKILYNSSVESTISSANKSYSPVNGKIFWILCIVLNFSIYLIYSFYRIFLRSFDIGPRSLRVSENSLIVSANF